MPSVDRVRPSTDAGVGTGASVVRAAARSIVRPGALCALVWIVVFGAVAVRNGPDATWDLLNYHLYGPFALFHGRLGIDIGPAEASTFLPPTLDIPGYWLRLWLNDRPDLLDALLSLPQSIGAYLATLIALRFVPAGLRWRWPLAMSLAAVGATGVASLSTVATSQSVMVPGCFILGGFLVLVRQFDRDHVPRRTPLVVAGLLFGVAAGLKLTSVPYDAGAAAAVLLAWPGPARAKVSATILFSLGVLGGMALSGGWWWIYIYASYGNPIFPLYNHLFRSPYLMSEYHYDERFKPAGPLRALFYPFYWGLGWTHPTAEPGMRDPRFAMAYLAFGVTIIRHLLRAPDAAGRQIRLLLVFFGVSYVLWEAEFSILRFLAPIEMLCGIVIFLPLRALLGSRIGTALAGLASAASIAVLLMLTFYPVWGHAKRGGPVISVRMPPVQPNSLVLLLDFAPMSYLVAYMPESVQIVGANNGLVHPGQTGLLEERVEKLINTWTGPIYGLENPRDAPGVANRALDYYRLRRGPGCTRVQSNLVMDDTLVCPLERNDRAIANP